MQQYVIDDIKIMSKNSENISISVEKKSVGKCPVCNSDVFMGKFGAYCSKKCGMSLSQAFKKQLTEKEVQSLLEKKKTLIKDLTGSNNKKFDAFLTPVGIKKFKKSDGSDGFGWDFKMDFPNNKK